MKRSAIALLIFFATTSAIAADLYSNFSELSAKNKEGIDYKIVHVDRKSKSLILAIHGGYIEATTDTLGEKIAGDQWSFYSFQGIRPSHNKELHITSAHFDEPVALSMVANAEHCLSLHGHLDLETAEVCVGGRDELAAKNLAEALRKSGLPIQIDYPCASFPANEPLNIVNRCSRQGVQLEMSTKLRNEFEKHPELLDQFSKVVRTYWQTVSK